MEQVYRLNQRRYYTIAAAGRALDVSETTLRKWISAKLVTVTMIGPPEKAFKRIALGGPDPNQWTR